MIASRSNVRVSDFLHFYTFQALLCFALRDPFGGTRFDLDNQIANRVGRFLFPRQGTNQLNKNGRRPRIPDHHFGPLPYLARGREKRADSLLYLIAGLRTNCRAGFFYWIAKMQRK